MLRISGITAVQNLFGLGKHGFRNGNKATGVVATKLTAEVFNAWQEEIAAVIEHNGIVLDSKSNAQLLAALKKMQGNLAGIVGYNANVNLSESDVGHLVYMSGAANLTATLPAPDSVPAGAKIELLNLVDSAYTVTVSVASGAINDNNNGSAITSRKIPTAALVAYVSNGVNLWYEASGSVGQSLLSTSGYQKLQSGLIIQWVQGNSNASGDLALTLPITFPNAILGGVANEGAPSGWSTSSTTVWAFDLSMSTNSVAFARVRNLVGNLGPVPSANIFGQILVWGC